MKADGTQINGGLLSFRAYNSVGRAGGCPYQLTLT